MSVTLDGGYKWVSVSERMPTDSSDVLVCHVLGDTSRAPIAMDVAAWIAPRADWIFPWDRRGQNPPPHWVTHWMPLPPAPVP